MWKALLAVRNNGIARENRSEVGETAPDRNRSINTFVPSGDLSLVGSGADKRRDQSLPVRDPFPDVPRIEESKTEWYGFEVKTHAQYARMCIDRRPGSYAGEDLVTEVRDDGNNAFLPSPLIPQGIGLTKTVCANQGVPNGFVLPRGVNVLMVFQAVPGEGILQGYARNGHFEGRVSMVKKNPDVPELSFVDPAAPTVQRSLVMRIIDPDNSGLAGLSFLTYYRVTLDLAHMRAFGGLDDLDNVSFDDFVFTVDVPVVAARVRDAAGMEILDPATESAVLRRVPIPRGSAVSVVFSLQRNRKDKQPIGPSKFRLATNGHPAIDPHGDMPIAGDPGFFLIASNGTGSFIIARRDVPLDGALPEVAVIVDANGLGAPLPEEYIVRFRISDP